MPQSAITIPRLQLQQERRSISRGLRDVLEDTELERRYARRDWRIQRHDIKREKKRGGQDIRLERKRGVREVGYGREDTLLGRERGREDFTSSLANLVHNYQVLGQSQAQQANASGITGGSTSIAAAAARAGNLARSRAPLDVELGRMEQDTKTQLGRLDTQQHDIRFDARRSLQRLGQDTRHDIKLGRMDLTRSMHDITLRRQRATREAAIGRSDLAAQLGALN